jgi:integrase
MARPKNITPTVKITQSDAGVWSCYWQDSATGKTVRRGCEGATSRDEVQQIATRRFAEWASPPTPAAYTIGQLVDAYLADRTAKLTEEERKAFFYNFKQVRPFFAKYTAAMLTPAAWEAYRKFRGAMDVNNAGAKVSKDKTRKPIKDSTIKRELNALRGAIIWGRDRKWVGLPGEGEMKLKGFDDDASHKRQFLTRDEFNRLLDTLHETPHLQLFALISVATAARMSAVLELKWSAVSIGGAEDVWRPMTDSPLGLAAHVEGSGEPVESEPSVVRDGMLVTKIRRPWHAMTVVRRAPITFDLGRGRGNKKRGSGYGDYSNKRLYLALADAYRNRRSEFVIEWRGKGVGSVDLSDAFERAEIPKKKRDLRIFKHTCCSWLRQAGTDWKDMAALTGTSEETLQRHYAHIAPDNLRKMSASLGL